MRFLVATFLLATAAAQSGPRIQFSHTTEALRGVSAVSRRVAWASGTHGTYLRTVDGGEVWTPAQVPDANSLDFRAVVAFSADEAFLMSAGPGDQSRIYHTLDGGQHWNLQFTNANPKGFFDSMVFWDHKHGIVVGDPVPDETGKLKFDVLITDDGQTWHAIPPAQLPDAIEGEGAFAASNTCIAIVHPASIAPSATTSISPAPSSVILSGAVAQAQRQQLRSRKIPAFLSSVMAQQGILSQTVFGGSAEASIHAAPEESQVEEPSTAMEERRFSTASADQKEGPSAPDPNIWFATGGKVSRVFHSPDRGKTWQVFDTPIIHGPDSAGIFSIAFRDAHHGVITGGDYKHPRDDGPNLAFTNDGGQTWTLSDIHPQAYFSAVAYDLQVNEAAKRQLAEEQSAEANGKKIRIKPTAPERLFIVGEDFVFDFRPPANPRRIGGGKKRGLAFNAVSAYPEGGALVVGPKGTMAFIP
ncbi:MAG TPA: hypothetical protein VKB49_28075 [Candidatus Sulfotelmatobacter sp.]|nr:hypothetical protein [Candidatus Sulfotelmatobacter sp.]